MGFASLRRKEGTKSAIHSAQPLGFGAATCSHFDDLDLLAPKFLLFYLFVASALYVHLRGRVRHRFLRQLTDHSTFMAPYNALMYLFSAVPNEPFLPIDRFPDLAPLASNWRTIRDEARSLFADGHIRAASGYTDLGFNSFFRRGWNRFPPSTRRCSRCCRPVATSAVTAIRLLDRFAITSDCRRRTRTAARSGSMASAIRGATARRSYSTKHSSTGRRTRPTCHA